MPTYDFECNKCGYVFESRESILSSTTKECPKCKGVTQRLIGAGSGIIFKGSGFYQTDYKNKHTSVSRREAGRVRPSHHYPYVSDNFIKGQNVVVKSPEHRKALMSKHGLTDARDYGKGYAAKKKATYNREKKEKNKKLIRDIYKKAKTDRKALHEAKQVRAKHEQATKTPIII